ncbi:MAG: dihydrofolate reductase [Candidatus Edwardsbacteria bacterium]|nr:dihydrofolate reductase [Candidatus Edwardsbacteria bacterium]
MPKKIIIVAMTKDHVIGKSGKMPWHISDDLKLFKKLTTGNTVIMGRTTYESIGKPLPKRTNIVVSATVKEIPGAEVCATFEDAVKKAEGLRRDIFFIGGASIYKQALPIADAMHVSWVKQQYAGDARFPEFDLARWEKVSEEDYPEFIHALYQRKRQ